MQAAHIRPPDEKSARGAEMEDVSSAVEAAPGVVN